MAKTKESLQVGCVVESNQGGDKGKLYIVVEVIDTRYIKIVDGIRHKLIAPKKKNIKHINVMGVVVSPVMAIDAQIVTALRRIKKPNGGINV